MKKIYLLTPALAVAMTALAVEPASEASTRMAQPAAEPVAVATTDAAIWQAAIPAGPAQRRTGISTPAQGVKPQALTNNYPFWSRPGGAWYVGYATGSYGNKILANNLMVLPGYAPTTWVGTVTAANTFQSPNLPSAACTWNYNEMTIESEKDPDGVVSQYIALKPATATTQTLEYPALIPTTTNLPVPTLSAGSNSYPFSPTDAAANEKLKLQISGRTFYDVNIGGQSERVFFQSMQYNLASGNLVALEKADATHYTAGMLTLDQGFFYDGETLNAIGFIIPASTAPYGLTSIVFAAGIKKYTSPQLKFDIYAKKMVNGEPALGERLGGGYINKEDIPVGGTSYTGVSLQIPLRDEAGETTWLNVQDDVFVMFSGFELSTTKDDINWQIIMATEDSKLRQNATGYVATTSKTGQKYFYAMASDYFIKQNTKVYYALSPKFGINGVYGFLKEYRQKDDYFKWVDAPKAGGTKNFEVFPSNNIYGPNAFVRFHGNGLNEWMHVTANDYANGDTNFQSIDVTLDPNPGADRSTTLTVEIMGAELAIPISQKGNGSGVEDVESASPVVSTALYDLQGRTLTAEPSQGLWLKRDTRADGTVTVSKVVK